MPYSFVGYVKVTALEEKLSKEVSNLSAEVAALKARLDYTLRQLYGKRYKICPLDD